VALVPEPERRWRVDLAKAESRSDPRPILDGCPCPACAPGCSRAYLHYLLRAGELTGRRLVTLHNLSFVARLMSDLRAAIEQGRLGDVASALRAGGAPGTVALRSSLQ
jgi:queuine tRNA-ribosyltransferase